MLAGGHEKSLWEMAVHLLYGPIAQWTCGMQLIGLQKVIPHHQCHFVQSHLPTTTRGAEDLSNLHHRSHCGKSGAGGGGGGSFLARVGGMNSSSVSFARHLLSPHQHAPLDLHALNSSGELFLPVVELVGLLGDGALD